ncbi:transcription termination factor MTERF2, chloroplastic-like [Neltuma alba]|uniref:transcription termination factor MTERF2, chloroplastic-like n=1 Tax=Neltuma alba TaxID=207710 RepID=UPI0010A48A6B|nr:transcription termination factor MTERF2, chloroplastic-like [Prosopis alba]
MSAEVAGKLSKKIGLKGPDRPDSVLSLLRSYEFSDAQISKIVKRYPQLLAASPEQNLLPKLRFIRSIGFSASELPELFFSNPTLLFWSLEKRIIPHYEALKRVLGDDRKVKRGLKSSWWNVRSYSVTNMDPNIKVLRDEGVPQSSVSTLLCRNANLVFISQSKFVECVKFVKETGIEPCKVTFIDAFIVVAQVGKSTWELKLAIFERLGWSRDLTIMAFCKFPNIMKVSEKKLTNNMKFFMDEMGLPLGDIAGCPTLFSYSLKRRIIPRLSVVKILKMKGLIKASMSILGMIILSEKKFRENFVIRFQESVPELLELYGSDLRPSPDVLAQAVS